MTIFSGWGVVVFLKWEIIRSKAMRCVGEKESSELESEEVSSCSCVDKLLKSMNDMVVSCKCVGILFVSNCDFCQNHDVQAF